MIGCPLPARAERSPTGPGSVDVAEVIEQDAEADQEAEVADAVDDERFDGGVAGGFLLVPETDQQIGAEADEFPEDEQLQQRPAEHQAEHGEAEQAEVGEEAREALVLGHVADGEDVDQRRDQRDHREHRDGQAVDVDADVEIAGVVLVDAAGADGDPLASGG